MCVHTHTYVHTCITVHSIMDTVITVTTCVCVLPQRRQGYRHTDARETTLADDGHDHIQEEAVSSCTHPI